MCVVVYSIFYMILYLFLSANSTDPDEMLHYCGPARKFVMFSIIFWIVYLLESCADPEGG